MNTIYRALSLPCFYIFSHVTIYEVNRSYLKLWKQIHHLNLFIRLSFTVTASRSITFRHVRFPQHQNISPITLACNVTNVEISINEKKREIYRGSPVSHEIYWNPSGSTLGHA